MQISISSALLLPGSPSLANWMYSQDNRISKRPRGVLCLEAEDLCGYTPVLIYRQRRNLSNVIHLSQSNSGWLGRQILTFDSSHGLSFRLYFYLLDSRLVGHWTIGQRQEGIGVNSNLFTDRLSHLEMHISKLLVSAAVSYITTKPFTHVPVHVQAAAVQCSHSVIISRSNFLN